MQFRIDAKDNNRKARAGIIQTDRGAIETPIFMPVGTLGTVKAVHQRELLNDIKAQIILGNTYHLYLRPGMDVLLQAGGLHAFNGWKKPILTDSGGFQIFSLSKIRKITEEGVTFYSHIDGSKHFFTPENVMDIQRIIGADFIMAFDECTPYPCDYSYAKESLRITHHWLDRCWDRFNSTEALYGFEQVLLPIVQGSVYKDLRIQSAEYVCTKDSFAYAIGGLSVGEPADEMYEMTNVVTDILPEHKPRYLMGVGTPENILECIELGIDMFDCVMPTRNARHGLLYTYDGIINIKNSKWKYDFSPIDERGICYVDTEYSKAYLRHLFSVDEILGAMIASVHNLAFYLDLVKTARKKIIEGQFSEWKRGILSDITRKI
ncbi:MAG: queuine tRNA-ribosyltransferase [Bacteroidia bacterium]|nr:MAG: queuine tRNA-ribosyltransferase [Bacteroidia bacterium]